MDIFTSRRRQRHNWISHNFIACSTPFAVSISLFALLMLFTACGQSAETADPYQVNRSAMRPAFQNQLDELGVVPRYDISVTLNADQSVLTGTAEILVPNNSPHLWNHLVFRLYPMLPQYGGFMTVRSVMVNERPTSFVPMPRTAKTALRVSLPQPLRPNESVQVSIRWKLEIPTWGDSSALYVLFGNSQSMTSLPLFYPSLAVYLPDATFGRGGWWTDIGTVRGDAAFNHTSLFVVTATMPSTQVPVASGTLITSTLLGDGNSRHVWATGPVREFLLHSSGQFSSATAETMGTRVTSYWLPGDEQSGRLALDYAVASLRIFTEKYGPYPYRDMSVAPAPLTYRGMEYPNVNLIGIETYNRFRNSLESLVVHEVAHQWWYQVVHNDPVNEPWLDEALAEYSLKFYMEALYGDAPADRLQQSRWRARITQLQNPSLPIGQSVMSFDSNSAYETVIYSKGAVFYDELRNLMGDRQFERFLQTYFSDHLHQIVDTSDWLSATRQLNRHAEIAELYEEWVGESILESQTQGASSQQTPSTP